MDESSLFEGEDPREISELFSSLKRVANSVRTCTVDEKRNVLGYFAHALGLENASTETDRERSQSRFGKEGQWKRRKSGDLVALSSNISSPLATLKPARKPYWPSQTPFATVTKLPEWGPGEMGSLMRSTNWADTPMGPIETWPVEIICMVSIALESRLPIAVLLGGTDKRMLYNDGYRTQILVQKHPDISWLQRCEDCFQDVWSLVGPMLCSVVEKRNSIWHEDMLLLLARPTQREGYFTLGYSPIALSDGTIGGILVAVTETTRRVVNDREMSTLKDLAALERTSDIEKACDSVSEVLSRNPKSMPFSLLYLFDTQQEQKPPRAQLKGCSIFGGAATAAAFAPPVLSTDTSQMPAGVFPWPLAQLLASPTESILVDLTKFESWELVSPEPWEKRPIHAKMVPLASATTANQLVGVLIVALNVYTPLDDATYETFIRMVGLHATNVLTNAMAAKAEIERLEALQKLDMAKTSFFHNISHEFRTPLTLMLGPLEELLAEQESTEGHATQHLHMVYRNSLRLLKLVNALLDFSRIEAGRMKAVYEPVDLGDLVSVFRSRAESVGLQLLVNLSHLAHPVYVDIDMWEKIILNLLSNAVKFTLKGSIQVRLREDVEDGTVHLDVEDTGVGIPEEQIQFVFQRFHRVDAVKGRSHEGTGIGLALVHELVNLHGGTITVKSTFGKGTCFTITLRYGQSHLPAEQVRNVPRISAVPVSEQQTEAKRRQLPFLYELRNPNHTDIVIDRTTSAAGAVFNQETSPLILVVDDNADMRAYIQSILTEHRLLVLTTEDGQKAFDMLQDNFAASQSTLASQSTPRIELVLTDIMMPVLDGLGLLRKIRQTTELASLPVILLSARSGDESTSEGLATGADDYLIKPFTKMELLARIKAHLHVSKIRTDLATKAQKALKFKDEFLALLSHELRTPLAPVMLLAETLEADTSLPAAVREDLQTIGQSVKMEVRLIDDLLDVNRLTHGKLQLQRLPVNIHQLIAIIIRILHYEALEKGVNVSSDLTATSAWVEADSTRLQQVLWNLLKNAIKFTPSGGHISIRTRNPTASWLETTVTDTGHGFEPDSKEKMFTAFEQCSKDITKKFGGLGLGLFICKQMITLHGGTISASSDGTGKGASFTFALPICQQPVSHVPMDATISTAVSAPAPLTKSTSAPVAKQPLRILLIEDNRLTRVILGRLLATRLGHALVEASCATEARAIINDPNRQPFDLVISDIGLPDGNGHELFVELRKTEPSLRGIALSGYAAVEDREGSIAAGFSAHLIKPVCFEALQETISRVLAEVEMIE